eukprot:3895116-Rhodomonas_salina.5
MANNLQTVPEQLFAMPDSIPKVFAHTPADSRTAIQGESLGQQATDYQQKKEEGSPPGEDGEMAAGTGAQLPHGEAINAATAEADDCSRLIQLELANTRQAVAFDI